MSNAATIVPPPDLVGVPRSGVRIMRDRVALALDGTGIEVTPVGLKYRGWNLNQSATPGAQRVVFIPGEFKGNTQLQVRKYGEVSRETRNHASVVNPREIGQFERVFTVSIWAAPSPGAMQDENDASENAENLLEIVAREILLQMVADVSLGEVNINAPPVDNGFGCELLLSGKLRGPLYDHTLEYVNVTLGKIQVEET